MLDGYKKTIYDFFFINVCVELISEQKFDFFIDYIKIYFIEKIYMVDRRNGLLL